VVSVLLLVVWVGSTRVNMTLFGNRRAEFQFTLGLCGMVWRPDDSGAGTRPAFEYWQRPHAVRWDFSYEVHRSVQLVTVPLWCPLSVSGLCAAAAWRLDTLARHRARAGLCPKCHYNRTGLPPQAVCPECGTAPSVAPSN
jgi:hypothetical protein